MSQRKLLACAGIELELGGVGAFDVMDNQVIGIGKPPYSGYLPYDLTSKLVGESTTAQVELSCKACSLDMFPPHANPDRTVMELLRGLGCTYDIANRIAERLQIEIDLPQGLLQYTERMMLMLNVAFAQGYEIAVYSTGGLDPMGIRRVLCEAVTWKAKCSSIVLFPAFYWEDYEGLNAFDKVIELRLKGPPTAQESS